jgi:hypothetical protein
VERCGKMGNRKDCTYGTMMIVTVPKQWCRIANFFAPNKTRRRACVGG